MKWISKAVGAGSCLNPVHLTLISDEDSNRVKNRIGEKVLTMNEPMKTYGVVINMDYAHQPVTTCKKLWNKIAEKMLVDDFRIEKRMFMITTTQAKENVYDKARNVLDSLNQDVAADKKIYSYLKDFFTVDMTEYVDLRIPDPAHGIELHENDIEQIVLN